jgi:uncharacterized Ntn-hydrolase superfamily protein
LKIIVPSTFSIVAADPNAGEVGIAVQSKFLAVGAVVPWVKAGVGAIATQAFPNTAYGPLALHLLGLGVTAQETIASLVTRDERAQERQYGIVDCAGGSASFTGERCIPWAGGIAEENFAVQGNCLASSQVVEAMASSIRSSRGYLADRLLVALHAGQAAGGDARGQQSAALIVERPRGGYAATNDRFIDLRVDDHTQPIEELSRLLELHKLYFFPALPEDVVIISDAIGSEIIHILRNIGILQSNSETFDENVRAALTYFMSRENLENRIRDDDTIDRQTLEYLRKANPVVL